MSQLLHCLTLLPGLLQVWLKSESKDCAAKQNQAPVLRPLLEDALGLAFLE